MASSKKAGKLHFKRLARSQSLDFLELHPDKAYRDPGDHVTEPSSNLPLEY
jgi:hypothetical protein